MASAPAASAGAAPASGTATATASPLNTFNALVGFVEQAVRPEGMASLLSAAATHPTAADITSLKDSVTALQRKLDEQAAHIETLRRR